MTASDYTSPGVESRDAVVSRRLREIIAGRQLEQKTLAAAAGMSAARLSRKLRSVDDAGWSLHQLGVLADVLGVSVTSLLDGR